MSTAKDTSADHHGPNGRNQWSGTDIAISDGRAAVADPTAIAIDEIWNVLSGCEVFPDTQYASLTGLARGSKEAQERQRQIVESLKLPLEIRTKMTGIRFRLIPAGTFVMGSLKSEQDAVVESVREYRRAGVRKAVEGEIQHKVTLTKAFYIGKYEVTQGQWKKVMGSNPSTFKDAGDNAPVENVSWHDCTNFMAKLAALEGMAEGSCRLPTEAQWEYACRAGTQTAFCYGNDLDSSMANFNGNYPYGKGKKGEYREKTVSVGQFKPNAWGLYDMHGNVWEWCADRFVVNYGTDAMDPTGPASGSSRVLRGSCWLNSARVCRSAYRDRVDPAYTGNRVGFRLSLPADQP